MDKILVLIDAPTKSKWISFIKTMAGTLFAAGSLALTEVAPLFDDPVKKAIALVFAYALGHWASDHFGYKAYEKQMLSNQLSNVDAIKIETN